MGDAASDLQKIYNKRYPPVQSRMLEEREFYFYQMQSGKINYYNLWPHTRDRLENWIEDHDIEYAKLQEALYTWSIRNHFLDSITVSLYIYWRDPELRTLFDLSW